MGSGTRATGVRRPHPRRVLLSLAGAIALLVGSVASATLGAINTSLLSGAVGSGSYVTSWTVWQSTAFCGWQRLYGSFLLTLKPETEVSFRWRQDGIVGPSSTLANPSETDTIQAQVAPIYGPTGAAMPGAAYYVQAPERRAWWEVTRTSASGSFKIDNPRVWVDRESDEDCSGYFASGPTPTPRPSQAPAPTPSSYVRVTPPPEVGASPTPTPSGTEYCYGGGNPLAGPVIIVECDTGEIPDLSTPTPSPSVAGQVYPGTYSINLPWSGGVSWVRLGPDWTIPQSWSGKRVQLELGAYGTGNFRVGVQCGAIGTQPDGRPVGWWDGYYGMVLGIYNWPQAQNPVRFWQTGDGPIVGAGPPSGSYPGLVVGATCRWIVWGADDPSSGSLTVSYAEMWPYNEPMPTATATATASASPVATPWVVTVQPTTPVFATPRPATGLAPVTIPMLGMPGVPPLVDFPMSAAPGCTPDDRPGQVGYVVPPEVEAPESSTNDLDWLAHIANGLVGLGFVIINAIIFLWNLLVWLLMPSSCTGDILQNFLDALANIGPIRAITDLLAALADVGSMVEAPSPPLTFEIADVEITVPLEEAAGFVAPFRPYMALMVWIALGFGFFGDALDIIQAAGPRRTAIGAARGD